MGSQDNRCNSFLPSCSLRTTVATVSSRRLTGSEADKLGRPPGGLPKHGLLPAGLSSLWDGQHHLPAQEQDNVLPLVLQLCSTDSSDPSRIRSWWIRRLVDIGLLSACLKNELPVALVYSLGRYSATF
ncbi:hypothetical protein ACOMHN_044742 [Nucella lapillus]